MNFCGDFIIFFNVAELFVCHCIIPDVNIFTFADRESPLLRLASRKFSCNSFSSVVDNSALNCSIECPYGIPILPVLP